MPGLNKNRKRSKTLAFRVSPEEYEQIHARIAACGLLKQEYIIESLLHQKITIRFGKYESDMLGVSIMRLRKEVCDALTKNDNELLISILLKCELLLSELCSIMRLKFENE